jgi:predicted DNA-binding transcriptional regulator YafY
MSKNKNALIRYRVINRCLIDYGICSKEKLIEACEETLDIYPLGERTIDKDIYDMRNDNGLSYYAPIKYDKIRNGYYYEDPDYSIDNLPLKQDEIEALAFASTLLNQFRNTPLFSQFSGAVQKIVDAVNIQKSNIHFTHYDFIDFERVPFVKGSEFLQLVIEAIRNKIPLILHYKSFDHDVPTDHVIHPYLLKEYRNRWYIIGLHEKYQEIRTFGLDRIISLETSHVPFKDKNFNALDYFKHTIGVISPQGKPPEIRFAVKKRQAQYLVTQPLHESQEIIEENDDELIFRLKVHPTYELMTIFMGYGGDLRIIEPEDIKKDFIKALRKTLEQYQNR